MLLYTPCINYFSNVLQFFLMYNAEILQMILFILSQFHL